MIDRIKMTAIYCVNFSDGILADDLTPGCGKAVYGDNRIDLLRRVMNEGWLIVKVDEKVRRYCPRCRAKLILETLGG